MKIIKFVSTHINPEPWAVGTAFSRRQKNGKLSVGVSPNPKVKAYQNALIADLEDFVVEYPELPYPADMPLFIRFLFWRQIESATVNDKVRKVSHVADTTNLQKSTEDALQGYIMKNDRSVVGTYSKVVAQGENVTPSVIILCGPSPLETKIKNFPIKDINALRDASIAGFEEDGFTVRNQW